MLTSGVLFEKVSSPTSTQQDLQDTGTGCIAAFPSKTLEGLVQAVFLFPLPGYLEGTNNVIEYLPSRHKSRLSKISARSDTATAPHNASNSLNPGYPREYMSQAEYLLSVPNICIYLTCLLENQAIVKQALQIFEIMVALWMNPVAQLAGHPQSR